MTFPDCSLPQLKNSDRHGYHGSGRSDQGDDQRGVHVKTVRTNSYTNYPQRAEAAAPDRVRRGGAAVYTTGTQGRSYSTCSKPYCSAYKSVPYSAWNANCPSTGSFA